MEIYWLQENITYWGRFAWILLVFPIAGILVYLRDIKWARYYGNNKIDVLGVVMSLKNYRRLMFFQVTVCVCVCVLIYMQFMGLTLSEKDVQLIYLKPRPRVMISFESLESYELRDSQIVLHLKNGRRYISTGAEDTLVKEIVLKMKERAPFLKERPMVSWRRTKWGEHFWWWM